MNGRKKDTKDLLRILEKQGCEITRTGRDHYKVSRNGQWRIIPSTPGRGRAMANTRAALKRALGVDL